MKSEYDWISDDKRKYKINFKIKDEEKIIVRVEEENIVKVIPDIYQQEFTKDELSSKEEYKMSFDSFDEILKHINTSFEGRRIDLKGETSGIVLSYYLFNNLKVDLVIPSYNLTPSENIDIYTTYFSRTKSFYIRYKKIVKDFLEIYKKQKEEKKSIISEKVINGFKDESRDILVSKEKK